MSGPDFTELVGDEGTAEELERLRHAHELLIAAGPPPELSPRLAEAPGATSRRRSRWVPRRRGTAFLLAGAVTAAAFGIGYLVGDRGQPTFSAKNSPTFKMHPPSGSSASVARASVLIGERDQVGNWPLLVRVSGLKPLPKGQWYELYLTRNGKRVAWCGAFAVKENGRTTVQFSVPYKLKGAGWVVTAGKRKAEQQVLLTT